ncbi:MAG: hypothetical protein AB7I59_30270 [Geminicoccaceae bacterium]
MIFRTVSAHIERTAEVGGTTASLTFKVEFEGSIDLIELETGEVIRDPRRYVNRGVEADDIELQLTVHPETRGRAPVDEGANRIGSIICFESFVTIRLYLADVEFERLLDSVSRGMVPTRFRLFKIEGLHYGGVEGERMRWNNKEKPVLPIASASWDFDIAAPTAPAEPAQVQPPAKPARRATWLSWVFFAVVIGVLALIFRK